MAVPFGLTGMATGYFIWSAGRRGGTVRYRADLLERSSAGRWTDAIVFHHDLLGADDPKSFFRLQL